MLNGKFNLNYLLFLIRCIKQGNNLKEKKFKRIICISSARGGSHLFASFFHNIQDCFCFDEAFSNLELKAITSRAFMIRGIYGINSLQDKKINKIENIFYLINDQKTLENENFLEKIDLEKDFIIYVFRNPLKTIISRRRSRKYKWQSKESIEIFLQEFLHNLRIYKKLKKKNKYFIRGYMLETIVENLDYELENLYKYIWQDGEIKYKNRVNYEEFFKKFVLCNSKPILKDQYLTSSISNEKIIGSGGLFNPIKKLSAERLFKSKIDLDENTKLICEKILGKKLYNYFLLNNLEKDCLDIVLSNV
ncbi:hypothetical protein OA859_00665 [Prochlorococcus sp. AH-716-D13]|nr:hypothetical protein [Prochlorococcus sp. AH-716-D13]